MERFIRDWCLSSLFAHRAPNLNTGGGNPKTLGLKVRLLREAFRVEEAILKGGVEGLATFKVSEWLLERLCP